LAGLGQHAAHGVVVDTELRGDRADPPLLGVPQPQDFSFALW